MPPWLGDPIESRFVVDVGTPDPRSWEGPRVVETKIEIEPY